MFKYYITMNTMEKMSYEKYKALCDELTELQRQMYNIGGGDFSTEFWKTKEYKKLEKRANKINKEIYKYY